MKIPFLKMHGAANDFVVIDHRKPFLPALNEDLVRRLCDRRRGVGADGVLLLDPDPELDFAMSYFNADGRPAEFCGNGARCVARVALEGGSGAEGVVRFRSAAGPQRARFAADHRRVELVFGRIAAPDDPMRVEAAGRTFDGRLVTAGVPHFVVPVPAVEDVPVQAWGAALRRHPSFQPGGANVDFIARLGPGRATMRTYERGVEAETLACGSGAMATAVWCALEGDAPPVTIVTAGGDELVVDLEPEGGAWNATLTGPAEIAYRGEWIEGDSAVTAHEEETCSKA